MKIVGVSNFSTLNDILACTEVNEYYGRKIVNMLNDKRLHYDECLYKLVNDDYELYVWVPC